MLKLSEIIFLKKIIFVYENDECFGIFEKYSIFEVQSSKLIN